MEPPTKNAQNAQIPHLSEEIFTAILARLPLRSITRFKLVCQNWKTIIESAHFRLLYLSLPQNSPSSWSLLWEGRELISFPRREPYDVPESSPVSVPLCLRLYQINQPEYTGGLVLIRRYGERTCFVGNPVLNQWIKLPPAPFDDPKDAFEFWLVNCVSSFKVFAFVPVNNGHDMSVNDGHDMSLFVYSSETGIWTSKIIHCPHNITNATYISLGGTVYLAPRSEPGLLLAYDLYSESDHLRVVHYPDHTSDYNPDFRRALTTSGDSSSYIYIRTLSKTEEVDLKIWKLSNDLGDGSWQLLWETSVPIVGFYVPMAMNPFDSGIVYLWSQQDRQVISCNLRTQEHNVLSEEDHDCFIYQTRSEMIMDDIWESYENSEVSIWLAPFILPQWVEPLPRPPEAEVVDTISVISWVT